MTTVRLMWAMCSTYSQASQAELRLAGFDIVTVSDAFAVPSADDPLDTLEALFEATNLYHGPLWAMIEPLLPARRSHTALSVGDQVELDGTWFECGSIGWSAPARAVAR